MGPYMISNPKFTPSFKIRSHEDEPQIPWGVVRIEFRDEKIVFGAIAPRTGPHAQDRDVQGRLSHRAAKIAIAATIRAAKVARNSGQSWHSLAVIAGASAKRIFAAYVHDPHTANPVKRRCPENPQYNAATPCRPDRLLQDILRTGETMTLRAIKILLVLGVAIFYSLVVFNNITDYGSNYEFVHHVMMMDTTFPGNHGMWRAINSPVLHTAFYVSIITWETITMLLCWWGGIRMAGVLRGTCRGVSSVQAHFHPGADAEPADVAGGVPLRRRGVVPDVAIEIVEWPGSSLPHVYSCGRNSIARGAA